MLDSMLSALVVILLTGLSAWIWSMLVNARPHDTLYLRPHSIRRGISSWRRKRQEASISHQAIHRHRAELVRRRAQDSDIDHRA